MFWVIIEKIGILAITTYTGKQLYDTFAKKVKIDKVYSADQVADILKVEKADVVECIHNGELKARKTKDTYHVLGKNLINYLSPDHK